MYKIIIIILLLLSVAVCKAQTSEELAAKASKLLVIQKDIEKKSSDKGLYTRFFDEFPGNFESFEAIYGFDTEADMLSVLYDSYMSHLDAFFSSRQYVGDTAFFKKAVAIALHGKWDADGVGMYQHNLTEEILNSVDVVKNILSGYADNEVYSFWYFILDGPHPDKQTPDLSIYKAFGTRNFTLIQRAYKDAMRDNEH